MDRGGESIAGSSDDGSGRLQAGLSLLFAPGTRPDADAIAALASAPSRPVGFAVTHRPADHPYWLELLILGLTFDLQGLAPGLPAVAERPVAAYKVAQTDLHEVEALTLRPGPHLESGRALLPVIRALGLLASELSQLPGLVAVGWEPARTAMSPEYFRKAITNWIDRDEFPAIGLTALGPDSHGNFRTYGLAYFLGYELCYCPPLGEDRNLTASAAIRLINDLVGSERYPEGQVTGPGGEPLLCKYEANRTVLRISRMPAA